MAFAPSVLLEPAEKPGPLPVRGLHLSAPARKDVDTLVSFIREGLDNHQEWEKRFYAEAEALRKQA